MLTDEVEPGIYYKDDPVQWEKADTDETEELAMLVLPGMWGSGCSSVLVCVLTFPLRRLTKSNSLEI